MEEFLEESQLLNYRADEIQKLANERGWKQLGEYDKIKEIYNFVKDEIKFGYNVADNVPATKVLKDGYGQCNTKATLFMALLRAAGVPCRLHGFTVEKSVQAGIMTWFVYQLAPEKILHSWVEVYYEGKWVELEGLILDGAYLTKLQKFYANCKGGFCGFGVSASRFQNPEVEWNGTGTYIQSKSIVDDFGVYNTPDEFYEEHAQELSGFKKFCYQYVCRHLMNYNVRKIRRKKEKTKQEKEKPAAAETHAENKETE